MNRIVALILALVMTLTLVSCATKPAIEKPEEPIEAEEKPDEINAGVFWYDFSDTFLSTVRENLNLELHNSGITYIDYDAKNTQATQNDQIDTAISEGVNLLIVNIVDRTDDSAQNIVDKAKDADIPVIFFNREVADNVINSYENACYVGTRDTESLEALGQMVGQYIAANYEAVDRNGDGYISYIMMKGELGNAESEYRTDYTVEFCNAELAAAGMPDLVYYDPNNTDHFQPSNWSKTTAFELMTTALSTNPMDCDAAIEVVLANNDDDALGCIEALNAAGFNTGESDFIPVFGIDYTAEAQAAIEAGKMTGSILQSATGMAQTIAVLAQNVATGANVFDGANENFNVDDTAAKIRVPYEIKMKG